MCLSSYLGPIIFAEYLNVSASKALCNKVNGKMFVLDSPRAQGKGMDLLHSRERCKQKGMSYSYTYYKCYRLNVILLQAGRLWAGWVDMDIEGQFVDINEQNRTLNSVNFEAWDDGEPNGDTKENCALLHPGNKWYDMSCVEYACGICDIRSIPTFTMRGTGQISQSINIS